MGGDSDTLFTIHKHTPAADKLNRVSGKRLAQRVQKNKVDHCQLIMINHVEEEVLCTTTPTEGTVIDK